MSALTKDRMTAEREGRVQIFPVAATTTLYAGSLACINSSGYAVPGAVSTTLTAVGRVEQKVVNVAAAGAETVTVKRGVFLWANYASDLVTFANIGSNCYILDDQTVAKTSATSTRSVAGMVIDVDADGVWVRTGY